MDPVTATQNAISSVFNFLSSPAGQKMIDQFVALDAQFIVKIKGLFDHVSTAAPVVAVSAASPFVSK